MIPDNYNNNLDNFQFEFDEVNEVPLYDLQTVRQVFRCNHKVENVFRQARLET